MPHLLPSKPWLWPLLVGCVSLAITAWLWQHERETETRSLRSSFNFGLRQTATRIEERVTSYEQMLRGVRGLFDATERVTPEDFARYVDALAAGADFAGLRSVAHAPLRRPAPGQDTPDDALLSAPITQAAPATDLAMQALGADPLADPLRRAAMLQARDSGAAVITERLPIAAATTGEAAFVLCMPLYARGQALHSVATRRAHLAGWVLASFRIGDLMSSLYGEMVPGLEVRLYDGVTLSEASRIHPATEAASAPQPERTARFEAQEYLAVAGHTWTLLVRSSPEFEQRFSSDAALIIAQAGAGLSLALALLTWQLVTGRERARARALVMTRRLRDSAAQYRRIVETASEGIWMVDAQARTLFVNPKLQQMLGYTEAQLLGRRWTDFMDDASRAALAGAGPQPGGLAEHLEIGLLRRDGSVMSATLSTSAIRDEAGRPAGALAMVTDITDRKLAETHRAQLEAQLRQAQKMEAIGTLAGGIAHDFNNILAAILGNAALAEQALDDRPAAAGRLAQIRQAGERGRSLVQQIVAFSRRQPQQRITQPMRPLLEDAARLLRATLPTLVELELRLGDAPLHVSADATQLQQVLLNLCTNAWHAMSGGTGRIVIGLEAVQLDAPAAERLGGLLAGPYARLWVTDDGSGMDEAVRLRIFEPFYTTKPVGQGTGLGLSVVHGIVVAHGGAIAVASTPGQGSEFSLYFPLAAPVRAAAAPPAAAGPLAAPRGQGQHVVYVDDDPVMGMMVDALLQRLGYRVSTLDDPRQALALATQPEARVELVITDFNMPELSGLGLATELQRLRPGLPVIISSGYVTEQLRSDAVRAGVRDVLQKEYTLEQLGDLVHRALGNAGNAG